jgi:hypothetical protein
MQIHAEMTTDTTRLIVVEAAGSNGGRKFGNYVNLRIVRLPRGVEYTGARQANAQVIKTAEANASSQGPRSNYARTLKAMIKELSNYA